MSTDERPWKLVTIADTERMTWLRIVLDDGRHGRMESTDLVEVRQESGRPDHMVVFGDLCPGQRGVVSDLGCGLSWFARSSGSPHYLASKFLATDWHAEIAEREFRERAAEAKAAPNEWVSDDPDEPAWELLQQAAEDCRAQEIGVYGAHEVWERVGGETDNCPGYGFPPRDFRLLVAIATRFARLWEGRA